ncbi:MAG TPA: NADH-quinone oxidoreductase subunit N [Deltaproteobacteria bacterium]|nr:MAG: NADH-quinone oxidoreductase subunit N [Deltaproteobacteria bacterium GWA2_55_82]OGQ64186.1 MAG: NADH-quinone oxidoreductase subunit N [Deltaproteobacteria bacterium RIFCSPLOWO2_02_FULL_55_12]OIJ74640.1 MAG: NADH-quinone oxidoreductase subunit N [Deltaproteobacteria bacterium GWC2_55_46]HBG46414.1 NADH-quinone oxidoreductase subunit N [Deltaproteobacteria bacterium]HCY10626.1 NADH-quinone oxidoreductase subunit N [Deltaproteobacteria bacterium]
MFFSTADIIAVLPEIIVSGAACLLLLVDLVLPRAKKGAIAFLSVITVLVAAWFSYNLAGMSATAFSGMFAADNYSAFFKLIFYVVTVFTILVSLKYLKTEEIDMGEYYVLMLFSLTGMMVMASGADLLTIYLGLELASLPVYVLVGFLQKNRKSNEASMKYIILGAFSSAILLYGMSLVYGLTGTTELSAIAEALRSGSTQGPLFAVAIIMLVAGFGFKIAGFPFHMWAPDAYEGAPTPVTAFMSAGPKAAAFAAILRVFIEGLQPAYGEWQMAVAVVAVGSMVVGNITAIMQTSIKRMLAYSSIGHAGYALLGLVAGSEEGVAGVMFYMFTYSFMNLGIFGIVIMMRKDGQSGDQISHYAGLAKSNKLTALAMLIFLFSLAGIPPTAGFVAKFYVFMALINKGMVTLAVIAALMSAAAAYFYIRIVMLMYMKEPEKEFALVKSWGLLCVLVIALAAVVALGVYPSYFINLARGAALPL